MTSVDEARLEAAGRLILPISTRAAPGGHRGGPFVLPYRKKCWTLQPKRATLARLAKSSSLIEAETQPRTTTRGFFVSA